MSFPESTEANTEVIFKGKGDESSEEDSIEPWPSLQVVIEQNKKKLLYEQGTYRPGSGEICTKYFPQSNSSILRHPHYGFPAIHDPGNMKALLQPEIEIYYSKDGQELYLALCEQMDQCPVRLFHTNLMTPEIDLCYYGVDPAGVRAMALALRYNTSVKKFNLSENFLNNDACFHLAEMLKVNYCLTELNLAGCRIKSEGAKLICSGLADNGILRKLNLERNELGDEGGEIIAQAIANGIEIKALRLGHNSLGGKTADALSAAFKICNNLTVLDLSWNNLSTPAPTANLLTSLSESTDLKDLFLSWNFISSERVGTAISQLLTVPTLRHLDLSNNRLAGEAITNFIGSLKKTRKLVTLNLSFNPLSPNDALKVVEKMNHRRVKLRQLLLDNVLVNEKFLEIRKQILEKRRVRHVVITYGETVKKYDELSRDPRDLILNRVDFLLHQPKKKKVDIVQVVMQLKKNNIDIISTKDLPNVLTEYGGRLNEDLINEIANVFPVISNKGKSIDIKLLADYVKRKWPERISSFEASEIPAIVPPTLEKPKMKTTKHQKLKPKKK